MSRFFASAPRLVLGAALSFVMSTTACEKTDADPEDPPPVAAPEPNLPNDRLTTDNGFDCSPVTLHWCDVVTGVDHLVEGTVLAVESSYAPSVTPEGVVDATPDCGAQGSPALRVGLEVNDALVGGLEGERIEFYVGATYFAQWESSRPAQGDEPATGILPGQTLGAALFEAPSGRLTTLQLKLFTVRSDGSVDVQRDECDRAYDEMPEDASALSGSVDDCADHVSALASLDLREFELTDLYAASCGSTMGAASAGECRAHGDCLSSAYCNDNGACQPLE